MYVNLLEIRLRSNFIFTCQKFAIVSLLFFITYIFCFEYFIAEYCGIVFIVYLFCKRKEEEKCFEMSNNVKQWTIISAYRHINLTILFFFHNKKLHYNYIVYITWVIKL